MVDRDGLENRCTFRRTVGSNPTPSAIVPEPQVSASRGSLNFTNAEGCQSGRLGTPGKRVYLHGYRGFESHPLRHQHSNEPLVRSEPFPLIRDVRDTLRTHNGSRRRQFHRNRGAAPDLAPNFDRSTVRVGDPLRDR